MHITANPRLPLEGLRNTRELGGYPVIVNGKQKHIKKGLIYRSGSPENIKEADKKILLQLNIKTTVDFRSPVEKSAFFDFLNPVKSVELPLDAGNLMGALLETGEWLYNTNAEIAEAEMIKLYSIIPGEAIEQYKALFSLLSEPAGSAMPADSAGSAMPAEPANAPLLLFCSAGKDRTGVASALILHALGAEMETIMTDYLSSSENLRPYWEHFTVSQPFMIPYYTVKKEYLNSVYKAFEKYGGIDNYLTKELCADIDRLRYLYTE